jgi:hypothetical protein
MLRSSMDGAQAGQSLAVFRVARVADLLDACSRQEWRVLVGLEDIGHSYPMGQLCELLGVHHKRHPVKPALQLILGGIRLVLDEVFVAIGVFVYLGDKRQLIGVLQVEQEFNRPFATSHLYGLAPDHD